MSKLIVVLGATSKQGGSVVDIFLRNPEYKVRGVTRSMSSAAGKALVAKGVEVFEGDLMNVDSLIRAFKGANVVYAMTTDFWVNMNLVGAATPTKSVLEKAYDMELQQGRNIVTALLSIPSTTLEKVIFSTLSAAKRLSHGKYTHVYHFDAKADVIDMVKRDHPELARKTAAMQLGFFANNWKGPTPLRPKKQPGGYYEIAACGPGDALHPFVVPDKDPAVFVHALARQPLGNEMKVYFGYGDMMTFDAWAALLSETLGADIRYKELTIEEFDEAMSWHKGVGRELGEMFAYSAEFGYNGGEKGVIAMKDLPLDRPPISMKEYVKQEDWSSLREELGLK